MSLNFFLGDFLSASPCCTFSVLWNVSTYGTQQYSNDNLKKNNLWGTTISNLLTINGQQVDRQSNERLKYMVEQDITHRVQRLQPRIGGGTKNGHQNQKGHPQVLENSLHCRLIFYCTLLWSTWNMRVYSPHRRERNRNLPWFRRLWPTGLYVTLEAIAKNTSTRHRQIELVVCAFPSCAENLLAHDSRIYTRYLWQYLPMQKSGRKTCHYCIPVRMYVSGASSESETMCAGRERQCTVNSYSQLNSNFERKKIMMPLFFMLCFVKETPLGNER